MMASDAPTKTPVAYPASFSRHHHPFTGTKTDKNRLLNIPVIRIHAIDGDEDDDAADDSHTINSDGTDDRPDAIMAEKHGVRDWHDDGVNRRSFNVDDLLVAYRNYRRHRHSRRYEDDDIVDGHLAITSLSTNRRITHHHQLNHQHLDYPSSRHLRQYNNDYDYDEEDDVVCGGDQEEEEESDEEIDELQPRCSCSTHQYIHRRNRLV